MADSGDLLRMQQDAIRRVRSMQQRAQQSIQNDNATPGHTSPAPPAVPPHPKRRLKRSLPRTPPDAPPVTDGERTVLLVLLLLLAQEDTDPELLLALLYLLM